MKRQSSSFSVQKVPYVTLFNLKVNIGDHEVSSKEHVRNLGVIFYSSMSMEKHMNSITRIAYMCMYNIVKIRKYLSMEATKSLVHAFIMSRLDCANGILYGIPSTTLLRLQKIQINAMNI